MKCKYVLAAVFSIVLASVQMFAQNAVLKPNDLKVLEGSEWVGSLTYRDYSSNKSTEIKSNILVSRSKDDRSSWVFDMRYPLEPKANKASDVRLSADGKNLAGETVVERIKLPGGALKVVTTKPGRDNDRDAVFRFTYLIGPKAFSIRKEVKVNETDGYFERNTYSWTR